MHLPRRSPVLLLELDLTQPVPEAPPPEPWQQLLARGRDTVRGILAGLRRAAADPQVGGLIVRAGGAPLPLATAAELRAGLVEFRRGGKPVLCWSETFGEFGRGTSGYLLATGADEIWLQPTGDVGLLGMAAEATFAREALDRAGVQAQVGTRHEYKNAPNVATERAFTEAHREAMDRLVASLLEQVVAATADARGLDPVAVRALVDRAPLSAADALAGGLVDKLGYRDEAYAAMRTRLAGRSGHGQLTRTRGESGDAGKDAVELRYLSRYAAHPVLDAGGAPPGRVQRLQRVVRRDHRFVALVDIAGGIRIGRSGRGPLGPAAGADAVTAALRAAAAEESVRAVVLRVDSPGGSYVASDAIWRATRLVRESGKPLVASMARVAGSGGYYVAMGADRILAQPTTLTGSIGVFAGKLVTDGLLERLGLGHDAVSAGANARMLSPRVPFDDEQLTMLDAWLDRVYADFTAKVGAGRGLDPGAVDAAARGRIWTGADAAERGLVDALGGLTDAADLARRLADLPPHAPVRPVPSPGLLDRLQRPRSSEDPRAVTASAGPAGAAGRALAWVGGWGEWSAVAAALGLPPAGPLAMPWPAMPGAPFCC